MIKAKKIRLIIILAIVLAVIGYAVYMSFTYFFYTEYEKYLTVDTFEDGKEFSELNDSEPKVDGMILAAENDILKLYTNTTTTEVAIYDKRSGETTYSNPMNRANDPLANGRNMVDLNSQFMLTYYDTSMTQITMYNYDYSVERGQYELENLENGIRYTYLLGNMDSPTGLVPPFIKETRLVEIVLSKLTEREAKSIRNNYMDSSTVDGFLELTAGAQSNKVGLQKMNKLIEKAGYTQADFEADAAAAAGGALPERTTFSVPLEYRLVEDKLLVTIPTEQIVETGSGKLGNIDMLSYFGAGGTDEEGYLLVPNGSGSLIYFNNGKKTERYNQYVYGMDEVSQSYTSVEDIEKARLPIYGIKHPKSAIFAEITSGDTLANIIAEVSGDTNSYNYVYPSFLIKGSEKVSMFGADGVSADLPTLEKDIYGLNLTITYSFLEEKDASYSGMATYYRNELIKRGELAQKEEEETIPFYLDFVGGVKQQKSILGVPYLGVYPMTSFDEAGIIVDKFLENQITNLRVNYLGWFNGGYYHDVATHVKVERKLGGKKDLEDLNEKLDGIGAKLFGDVAIQKVSFASDNFAWKMESARYYSGYIVNLGRVNPATLRQTGGMGYMETNYDVLSPKFLVRHIDKFINSIDKIEISGIALRDLGDTVASDRKRTNVINRQEAKKVIVGQFELLDEAIDNLMVNGGNAYSLAYASDLVNVPTSHNPFYIVDEEVPFYQMVIHGCIDYTSGAINLSDSYDKQDIILRMLEYGTAPHFTLSYEESSNIKYSGLNSLYSTQYESWLSDAVEIYQKTNEVLKYVVNSNVTDHAILESGIKRITYDNGIVIYINTNDTDANVDGASIPAMSYLLEGVKE
ncbi:MAG: DUF5696 domain-containing protein [Mobilitalea sp.]